MPNEDVKPQLIEVDDSASGRFPRRQAAESPQSGGVVEIELEETAPVKKPSMPAEGIMHANDEEVSDWPEDLRAIFSAHALQKWERTFTPTPSDGPAETINALASDNVESISERAPTYRDRFVTAYFPPEGDVQAIVEDLQKAKSVKRAVAISGLAPALPTEPLLRDSDQVMDLFCSALGCLENQWYIFRCKVHEAWDLIIGDGNHPSGAGVVIAAIDWGINPLHEDLNGGRIQFSLNTITGNTVVSNGQRTDHGTAVLGLAAATNNGRGVAGVAPNATLWAIQAGDDATVDHGSWANAIDRVIDEDSQGKRKVLLVEAQMSNGRNVEMIPSINAAIQQAISKNIVVCVPAGNGGYDAGKDSAGNDIPSTGSILIGATVFDPVANPRWSDSNHGERVTIYAPGDPAHDVTCGPVAGTYRRGFGGTSGATPKVAGTIALMLEANPSLTHDQIRTILKETGTPLTGEPGSSFLNAEAAVRRAINFVQPQPLDAEVADAAAASA